MQASSSSVTVLRDMPPLRDLPICGYDTVLITTGTDTAVSKLVHQSEIVEVNPMDAQNALALLDKELGRRVGYIEVVTLALELGYMPCHRTGGSEVSCILRSLACSHRSRRDVERYVSSGSLPCQLRRVSGAWQVRARTRGRGRFMKLGKKGLSGCRSVQHVSAGAEGSLQKLP